MIPTPTAGGSVAQEVTPVNCRNGIYALLILVFLSSTCFAENAPAKETLSPELHVSVYDHANLSQNSWPLQRSKCIGFFGRREWKLFGETALTDLRIFNRQVATS